MFSFASGIDEFSGKLESRDTTHLTQTLRAYSLRSVYKSSSKNESLYKFSQS